MSSSSQPAESWNSPTTFTIKNRYCYCNRKATVKISESKRIRTNCISAAQNHFIQDGMGWDGMGWVKEADLCRRPLWPELETALTSLKKLSLGQHLTDFAFATPIFGVPVKNQLRTYSQLLFPAKSLIPPLIGNLAKLRTLALSYNGLSDPIPESIGKLSKLEEVHLNSNNFSGSLPSGLGDLSSLGTMDLTSNHFSGSIGNLMNLVNLYLENNLLTGFIPKSIGRIPSFFGQLKSLVTLSIENNQLEGPVPSNLGQLQSLAELNLGGNRLSGRLLKTIGLLPLFTLSISNNMIEGPLPVEMSSLTNLSRLYLSFNPLNLSSIPTWLVDMPSINAIHLAGCGIEGEIPRHLQSAASRWAELDLWKIMD
ncbi:probable leucine-rich repeat receptor-like protein kinase At1g35710 [Coffea eugenioides]|uniref:probable leucine-rich repeat receptor-like protein kinase At1g35710 n=1 Tax=Coffea eugenioides TaxID=49369 RepID=UPI000F60B9F1|nr:probable leucine-rich repeat receptor-like protein kinase At1g35710 [Coffea eugenioides]